MPRRGEADALEVLGITTVLWLFYYNTGKISTLYLRRAAGIRIYEVI